MEMSSPEPPTLSQMNTDSDSDLGNESDLISSQEHQLAPETVEHRNRVGADFEMFCKSRRWGPTQIRSLRGYVRHLFKNKKFVPTTVSTEFSLLRPYLQKVHHATFDAVELKPVFQYIDAKTEKPRTKEGKSSISRANAPLFKERTKFSAAFPAQAPDIHRHLYCWQRFRNSKTQMGGHCAK